MSLIIQWNVDIVGWSWFLIYKQMARLEFRFLSQSPMALQSAAFTIFCVSFIQGTYGLVLRVVLLRSGHGNPWKNLFL